MTDKQLNAYAEVVIKKGIVLYKGQCVSITCGLMDYPFALRLAEAAYKNGAKFVEINPVTNELVKLQLEYGNEADLEFVPQFVYAKNNEYIADDWAFIRIDNTSELDVLKDVDSNRLNRMVKSARIARKRVMEVCSKHKMTWCVIASPNANWAAKVFNGSADNETLDKLNQALIPILRLDQKDPVKAWEEHGKKLNERAKKLSKMKFKKLILLSDKTNLEIGLTQTSVWAGGPKPTPDGRNYIPNIPTEEVFTTPDYRKTTGHVATTRPVKLMEKLLHGVWFEFKEGKVVRFGADNDQDILEKFIETDDQAAFLGEIALVDVLSPIYQSNLIFNSILYDENASCHIALGNGYPSCLTNGQELRTRDELMEAGCNVSLVHTDFMIGSEDLQVLGIDVNDHKHVIMKNGLFEF